MSIEEVEQQALEQLALDDLTRAGQILYFAAKQYCAVEEHNFVQSASGICSEDPSFVRGGGAASELVEASNRFDEAYKSWEKYQRED